MSTSEAAASGEGTAARVSRWRPRPTGPARLPLPGFGVEEVVWCDLQPGVSAEQALAAVGPLCPGLTREMLDDLLTRDTVGRGESFVGARLVSTCLIEVPEDHGGSRAGIVVVPVELLAADRWLVTYAHPAAGAGGTTPSLARREGIMEAVKRRWGRSSGSTGGDLGILLMRELALTYAPAVRRLEEALEAWELELYRDRSTGAEVEHAKHRLERLWEERAELRGWVSPLNRSDLADDLDRAWLPTTLAADAEALDDRIDRVLRNLRELGTTLRSSFQLLHVEAQEVEKERRERVQRRVEIVAAIFLIPTLVVGFYGANTWVPGQGEQWGFWVMVAALVVLTVAGVIAVRRMQRLRAERARLAEHRFDPL